MKKYSFYSSENVEGIKPINDDFLDVKNPLELYKIFKEIFDDDTCAPRMRKDWTKDNFSLGHCSIASFLVQDIFGGEVFGIPLLDGNYHCFNIVDGIKFDLTSEQFDKELDYENVFIQTRETHFKKEEKYERYLLLKRRLVGFLGE